MAESHARAVPCNGSSCSIHICSKLNTSPIATEDSTNQCTCSNLFCTAFCSKCSMLCSGSQHHGCRRHGVVFNSIEGNRTTAKAWGPPRRCTLHRRKPRNCNSTLCCTGHSLRNNTRFTLHARPRRGCSTRECRIAFHVLMRHCHVAVSYPDAMS